jgi:hypothetical protein
MSCIHCHQVRNDKKCCPTARKEAKKLPKDVMNLLEDLALTLTMDDDVYREIDNIIAKYK